MRRRGRLWIVTRKHPPAVGGMEQLSFRLSQELASHRPVTVLQFGGSRALVPFFVVSASLRLLFGLVLRNVSVVLLGDPVLSVVGVLPRLFGVPAIVVVHGLDVSWPNRAYQAYLRALFWNRFEAYVCISRYTADLVRSREIHQERIVVIPVGVDEVGGGRAAEIDGDPVLLLLGRLVPRKGAAWFVRDVMPRLVAHFPRLMLVVAGDGAERESIEAARRDLGMAHHVRMTGPVSNEHKWTLFARCDLVVVPNLATPGDTEGFGIVAIEAGAAGKPAMVADLEGLRDAVSEDLNGWRVPAGDADAWVAAIAARVADRTALRVHGEKARAFVREQFDWRIIGARYEALVDRVERGNSIDTP